MYESLKILNGLLALLTSLCLFIFITTSISCEPPHTHTTHTHSLTSHTALIELSRVGNDVDREWQRMHVAVGVINFSQWTLLALAPLIQVSH